MDNGSEQDHTDLYAQCEIVRDRGNVNMMDLPGVMREADQNGCYGLVAFLAEFVDERGRTTREGRVKYMSFLHGFSAWKVAEE